MSRFRYKQAIATRMKQLKRQHGNELSRAASRRIATTEAEFAVEAMSHAFSMFRASEEWQEIGRVGRWVNAWLAMWRTVGSSVNVHTLMSAADAYNFHIGQRLRVGRESAVLRVTAIDHARGTITLG